MYEDVFTVTVHSILAEQLNSDFFVW